MRSKTSWRKAPKVSKLAEHEENAEIALEDEDMELFAEYGGYTRFLTSMNAEELTRNEVLDGPNAIMRAKGGLKIASAADSEAEDEGSDAEASYENRPRSIKAEWKKEEKARLPIRGDDGSFKMQHVVVTQEKGVSVSFSRVVRRMRPSDHGSIQLRKTAKKARKRMCRRRNPKRQRKSLQKLPLL